MAKEDDRLQRNLNALERRERRSRVGRRAIEQEAAREPRVRAPLAPTPATPVDVEEVEVEVEAPDPPAEIDATDETAGSNTDGLPPRLPAEGPPRNVQADHLSAAVAALRQLAATRPGFDVVVADGSSSGRDGTRITWVPDGPPRVTLAQIDQSPPPVF